MTSNTYTNHLANETSPYLLQHAHNPVDWWPWCAEALDKAKQQNKLILLSIGYSACHWCHVMAHESFEDADTAAVMNELFINIKVDREERPDLDKIYQTAHQLLNQRPGGWPLTMILTPNDHIPFFAGTYFPVTEKHGMPAFKELLHRIANFYSEHPDQIQKQNTSMISALNSITQQTGKSELNVAILDQARHQLAQQFDEKYAGFGKAPKFPHPSNLERLLRHWYISRENGHEDQQALHMLRMTLHAMASGGIYDQLGGGFYRYSVDDFWMIPHFEKMLYDNGPLLSLYVQAYSYLSAPVFFRIAHETADWTIREMQSPQGGYYSTLDADSEGEEGKYYVWQPEQVKSLLNEKEYLLISEAFGLSGQANFEGNWHFHVYKDLSEIATQAAISMDDAMDIFNSAREKLFHYRQTRIAPGRDDKILTAWNGLMIKAMAQAGRILQQPMYIESAMSAAQFIHDHLYLEQRLLATYKDGQAKYAAYLDDYAFLLDALLELLQARWNNTTLFFAIEIADTLLEQFEDKQHGGFFFTAHDHESLIQRPKPVMDEAIPSGNAVAAYALARLGHLLADTRYLSASEHALYFASPQMNQAAYACAFMLHALEEHLYPPQVLIIRGNDKQLEQWHKSLQPHTHPRRMTFYIPAETELLPGTLKEKTADPNRAIGYYCAGNQCHAPVYSPDELISLYIDIA